MPKVKPPITMSVIVNPRRVTHLRDIDHARSDLACEYFTDLFEAWHEKGRAVLDTVAMMYPDVFLKVVASHMPREMHATITTKVERLSNAELNAIVAEGLAIGYRTEETTNNPAQVQPVGTPESV